VTAMERDGGGTGRRWNVTAVERDGGGTRRRWNGTAVPVKRTAVERQVNVQIVFLFMLLMALLMGGMIGTQ
jgi:phospholipid-transporting ATPase